MSNSLSPENDGYNDHDWKIPRKKVETPRTFSIDELYTPDDFIQNLRALIDFALKSGKSHDYVNVFERWESRVLDYIDHDEAKGAKTLIGFETGDDGITRLYFVRSVENK